MDRPEEKSAPDHIYTIPSELLSYLLELSRQQLTKGYYEKFTKEAGLEEYVRRMPIPENETISVHSDQISKYMALIFSVMQEGAYPLFAQNIGLAWAKDWIKYPGAGRMKAKVQSIFGDPRLPLTEKLREYIELENQKEKVTIQTFRAEGHQLYLDCPNCVYCRAIKTDRMVCLLVKTWYATAIKWLTERTFTVEQIASTARGDGACVHRFTFL